MTTTQDSPSGTRASKRAAAPSTSVLSGGRRTLSQQRPRNRSWGLVVLAALLVVGTGLAVAAWGLSAGNRDSVLAVNAPITKGQVIERSDLVSTSVSGVEGAVLVEDVSSVVGKTAAVDLVSGQIITTPMVTSDPVPGEGQSTVGLALDPTRVPGAGLDPGDTVEVIAVPGGDGGQSADTQAVDTPEVLASSAEIYSVGGEATSGGQLLLTLIVDADDAARIAAYSTQNRIAVIEAAPAVGANNDSSTNGGGGGS